MVGRGGFRITESSFEFSKTLFKLFRGIVSGGEIEDLGQFSDSETGKRKDSLWI